MKKNLIMAVVLAATAVFGSLAMNGAAMAKETCPKGSLREGKQVDTLAECNVPEQKEGEDLMSRVKVIINVVISIVGLAAVAVIILGGVTFITSQGDVARVAKAKNTLIYGIVGLVVAIMAFAIVNFVLSSVFSGGAKAGTGGGE